MSFFHLKHNTLKQALTKALEMGLVSYVYRTDSKGVQHKDLQAKRFNKNGVSTIKLHVCTTKYGRRLYVQSMLKDLREQYQNQASSQSIIDVMDLLILVKVLSLIKQYDKLFDCNLRQACHDISEFNGDKLYSRAKTLSQYKRLYRKMQREIPTGTVTFLNCGYSIDKMLNRFGSFVKRHKIQKLLIQANQDHDGLFHTWKNSVLLDETGRIKSHSYKIEEMPQGLSPMGLFKHAYHNYDLRVEGYRQGYKERFMGVNENGDVVNLHDARGCYIAKRRKRCLAMPMANTYYMQCDPFVTTGRKLRRKKSVVKAGECKYPSVVFNPEVHIANDNKLPF